MIALLQRKMLYGFLVIGLVVPYIVIGTTSWTLLSVLWWTLALISYPSLLWIQILLMRKAHAKRNMPVLDLPIQWAVYKEELRNCIRTFCVHQPFESDHILDIIKKNDDRPALLFIHGYFCNRAVWKDWMEDCHRLNIPFMAITLRNPFDDIDSHSEQIEAALQTLALTTKLPVHIVAHSMGGLAARACIRNTKTTLVQSLTTLGTPHQGTLLAQYGRNKAASQMKMHSVWLTKLEQDESNETRQYITCYKSDCDHIVYPTKNAWLPNTKQYEVNRICHVSLVRDPTIRIKILRELGYPA